MVVNIDLREAIWLLQLSLEFYFVHVIVTNFILNLIKISPNYSSTN